MNNKPINLYLFLAGLLFIVLSYFFKKPNIEEIEDVEDIEETIPVKKKVIKIEPEPDIIKSGPESEINE